MTDNLPTMDTIKAEAIRDRLTHFDGNRTRAAASLGISLRAMRIWAGKIDAERARREPSKRAQKAAPKASVPSGALDERVCACGCRQRFWCLPTSPSRFASQYCEGGSLKGRDEIVKATTRKGRRSLP